MDKNFDTDAGFDKFKADLNEKFPWIVLEGNLELLVKNAYVRGAADGVGFALDLAKELGIHEPTNQVQGVGKEI